MLIGRSLNDLIVVRLDARTTHKIVGVVKLVLVHLEGLVPLHLIANCVPEIVLAGGRVMHLGPTLVVNFIELKWSDCAR